MTFAKLLITSILPLYALAQTAGNTADGYLELKEPIVDLGTISRDSIATVDFVMYNTGTGPVTIIKITSSCNCAVPYYRPETIAPGDSALFEVKYFPSGYEWGEFQRDFIIHSTATNSNVSAEITGIISRN